MRFCHGSQNIAKRLQTGGFHIVPNSYDLTCFEWVLRSGAPRRDLPERYGPRTTCNNRFVRAFGATHDGNIQMIDDVSVRAINRPRLFRERNLIERFSPS